MAIAFVPLFVWAVTRKGMDVPLTAIFAMGLAVVPLLQLAAGLIVFAGDALLASLYLAGFGLAVLTGSRYVCARPANALQGLDRLSGFCAAITLAALISVGIGVHQWFDLQLLAVFVVDMPFGGRVYANLAQPNQFATLLLTGLASLLFLFESRRVNAFVATFAALLIVLGLVMSGSRSVLIALCFFWLCYLAKRKRIRLRVSILSITVLTLSYFVLTFFWSSINDWLLLSKESVSAVERLEPGIRVIYWKSMLYAISLRPWAGYGWNQISTAQSAVALNFPSTHTFFESSHNLFLDLFLWNGVPIGLFTSLWLVIWFVKQIKAVEDPLKLWLLISVGFVFCHAMVEFPLSYAYFLLPVGFLMGALNRTNELDFIDKVPQLEPFIRHCLISAAVMVAVLFAMVTIEYPAFEKDWQSMRFEEQGFGSPPGHKPAEAVLLTQLGNLLEFIRTPAAPGLTGMQLEKMRQVAIRYGYSSALFRYATAAGINNDESNAERALTLLCSMHTPEKCKEAKAAWLELSQHKFPVLKKVPWPVQDQ